MKGFWLASALAIGLAGCVTEEVIDGKSRGNPAAAVQDRVSMAMRYIQNREPDKAQRHLQRALEIDPDSAEVHHALAVLYESEGNLKQAEKHYRKAVRVKDDFAQAQNNYAGFLYRQGRFKDAYEYFDKAANNLAYENRDAAYENLGYVALRLERKAQAEQAFIHSLRLNGRRAGPTLELAVIAFDAGQTERAKAGYKRFLELNGEQPQSARSLWLGIRLARLGNDANALASYELALKRLYPGTPEYQAYTESLRQGQ